jgi:hypothetical protein
VDRFVVETARSENAFARIRRERDGAELLAELIGSDEAGRHARLYPGDVITGELTGTWIKRPILVEPIAPPAELIATHRAGLEKLARAGFDVLDDDASCLRRVTEIFRRGASAGWMLATAIRSQRSSVFVDLSPDLAAVTGELAGVMAARGWPFDVQCVPGATGRCTGFRFAGSPDVVPLGDECDYETPELCLSPVVERMNAALARLGVRERWLHHGNSWELIAPDRARVLEELGIARYTWRDAADDV